jgi:hypothetical protein
MRAKGPGRGEITTLVSIIIPEKIPLQLLLLQLLEVAGIQIEIIRLVLTVSTVPS